VSNAASPDETAKLLRRMARPDLAVHRHAENLGSIANIRWLLSHAPDAEHQLQVFLQQKAAPYTVLSDIVKVPSGSPSTSNTVVFQNVTASDPNVALVFMMYSIDPRIYIDNIDLYLANVTPNNLNNNYIFKYNASKSAISVPLSATYQDANGVAYQGSVTLQPYTSVVLFKK